MNEPLLQFPIRTRKDLLRCRLRVRHLGRYLGLEPLDQAKLACVAFELAILARQGNDPVCLTATVEGAKLQLSVTRQPRDPGREPPPADCPVVSFPLPVRPPETSLADIAWMVANLPPEGENLFEEIRQQNNDLLQLFLAASQGKAESPKTFFHKVGVKAA